jgi:hypothetical protein
MLDLQVRTRSEIPKVLRAAKRAKITSLGRAAAYTRGVMRNTLGRRKTPRPPGQPAASPTNKARRSVLFYYDRVKEVAIIGPSYRMVGRVMYAHEKGKRYKGDKFPARPFGEPTIRKAAPKLSEFWRGSVTR